VDHSILGQTYMTGLQQTLPWEVKWHWQQYSQKLPTVLVSSLILLTPIVQFGLYDTLQSHILLFVLNKKCIFALRSLSGYHRFVMKNGKLLVLPLLYQ